MQCPTCNTVQLVMAERQGIEIDYCPQCRGVWLDRGELDKLIERSVAATPAPPTARQPAHSGHYAERRHDDDEYTRGRKRRKGFLSDIFDFD